MKRLILFVVFAVISSTSSLAISRVGHEGNGGDAVEAFFIEKGTRILERLSRTESGQSFLRSLPVGLVALTDTLDHSRVSIYKDRLHDVTGAEVDALVNEGIIYLSSEIWLQHMQSTLDIDNLVFHEMLRSAGVNDDNYIYSNNVKHFSDLVDPRQAMTLSQYINPNQVQFSLTSFNQFEPIENHTYTDNMGMKLEISVLDQLSQTTLETDEQRNYLLNIPIYNSGLTKIIIYRIDYEYQGFLQKGTSLNSIRGVQYESSMKVVRNNKGEGDATKHNLRFVDLMSIESAYKESLQVEIRNNLIAHEDDTTSFMVLKRIVVYFNILRL